MSVGCDCRRIDAKRRVTAVAVSVDMHYDWIRSIIAISLIQFLSEGWIRPSAEAEGFLFPNGRSAYRAVRRKNLIGKLMSLQVRFGQFEMLYGERDQAFGRLFLNFNVWIDRNNTASKEAENKSSASLHAWNAIKSFPVRGHATSVRLYYRSHRQPRRGSHVSAIRTASDRVRTAVSEYELTEGA